jgi:hypothetical protein
MSWSARGVARALLAGAALVACDLGPGPPPDVALYADGLDSPRSVAPQPGLRFDPEVSADGRGSFRVDATGGRTVVRLADVTVEAPRLPRMAYRAKLRAESVAGRAYLEMWVRVKKGGVDQGEFFSRALHSQLSGTSDWSTHEAPFAFQPDEEPTRAKLNVVIEGTGSVWIDAITLRAGRD